MLNLKFLLILFIMFSYSIFAQTDQKTIQNKLNLIFNTCKAKDYNSAALMILYSGKDESRKWKSSFNAEEKSELRQVKRVCKKIEGFLRISSSFSFGSFSTETEKEGKWYIQEVNFSSGRQSLSAKFAFLKVGGKFLLGDID